jgi:hypothetical protein
VHDFLERKRYLEKFPHTAPPYDQLGVRWMMCDRYYTGKVAEYQELMEKNAG